MSKTAERPRFIRGVALSTNSASPDVEANMPVGYGPHQISAYFLDLERLLSRVEFASTFYQVLEVDRSATQEQIRSSYDHLVSLFFPSHVIGKDLPVEVASRIERAFKRASQAFAVLASFHRRKEYDDALCAGSKPAIRAPSNAARSRSDVISESQKVVSGNLDLKLPKQAEAYSEFSQASSTDNRRRCERLQLTIPARVTGHDRKTGKWHEMTEALDVSRTGARLRLRTRVKPGMVLYLALPLPPKLRRHGFGDASYNVYGLVRRVEPPKQGMRAVGVEFLGENPPAGYLDKPWAVFRSKAWNGVERRRQPRAQRPESVRLEYFDDSMNSIGLEEATTENVSRKGLRVVVAQAPYDFDLIRLMCPKLKFESLAALRNRYRGTDGRERLCLQLVDYEWPHTISGS